MQPISSFNSNLGTAIAIVGPAGSGKTVLGMRLFPKTYVVVLDLNFQSGKRYLEKLNKLTNVIGFDTISVDETGKPVIPQNRYDRLFQKLNAAASDPSIDAIFVDGATQITECIMAKLVGATKESEIQIKGGKDSWPLWGTLGVTWRGLISQLRTTGKKLVLAVHEQKNQDESDKIWKHELLIPGQTKDMLPNLMSDVWRTEVEEKVRTITSGWCERCQISVWNSSRTPTVFRHGLPADELVQKIQARYESHLPSRSRNSRRHRPNGYSRQTSKMLCNPKA
jgi:hypothetical protein